MRIAWIGPMPSGAGGAGGVSSLLLCELNAREIETDCYVPGSEQNLPENLRSLAHVNFICGPSSWEWNRWYSRNRLLGFITGQIANLKSENRLARLLLANHRDNPYDVVYQFSHIEFSALRKFRSELPPIVLHPSVHALGELRNMRAERHLARAAEPLVMRAGARLLLRVRSYVQKRHIRYADLVLALSRNFANDLTRDYGVPANVIKLVPNPIDLKRFRGTTHKASQVHPTMILFVSRISVRKGVEMVIELSHRLDDLRDDIVIQIVGDKSMWSDYTRLLSNLNCRVAQFVGPVSPSEMHDLYNVADILIQPSHYEPFGLTVGEALSSGIPVVASDKVGAAEDVSVLPCRTYRDHDMDDLENQVRALIYELRDSIRAGEIRTRAREEAERLFSAELIGTRLIESLQRTIDQTKRAASLDPVSNISHEMR